MNTVSIVGHGPSLLEPLRGELIDSADFVVRQKNPDMNHPAVFGSRMDAFVGSWNQKRLLDAQMWVFIDSRFECLTDADIEHAKRKFGCRIDRTLCDEWNAVYRAMRTPVDGFHEQMSEHPIASDKYGHRHMSSGLHAVLYACAFLKPKQVTLYGYDNVQSGSFTWSISRGPDFMGYANHRWDIEKEILPVIGKAYNVEITHG